MQRLRTAFATEQRAIGWQALALDLAACHEEIAHHRNFNHLLTHGEALFVHCSSQLASLQCAHPFPRAQLVDCDLSMDLDELKAQGDGMVTSSGPTTDRACAALRWLVRRVSKLWSERNGTATALNLRATLNAGATAWPLFPALAEKLPLLPHAAQGQTAAQNADPVFARFVDAPVAVVCR
jgi:hypothetical protein